MATTPAIDYTADNFFQQLATATRSISCGTLARLAATTQIQEWQTNAMRATQHLTRKAFHPCADVIPVSI